MKMVCVGRNYETHIRELGNEIPEDPILFLKPETALLGPGEPFRIPPFSTDIHHEIELVLQICRRASNVAPEDAPSCYDAISVGLDLTARDVQTRCKAKGLPWEIAKAFDGSAAIGEFIPVPSGDILFELRIDGRTVQSGDSKMMITGFADLVSYASRFFTLEPGDLVFTGTPAGVGPVAPGNLLEGFLAGKRLLACQIA